MPRPPTATASRLLALALLQFRLPSNGGAAHGGPAGGRRAGFGTALLLDGDGGHFLETAGGPPLGAGAVRRKGSLRLDAETTVLLFTEGLVESRAVSRSTGMERLRLTAADAPSPLDDLCEHVVETCMRRLRRDDDICLVGFRLVTEPATAVPLRGPRG